MVLFHVAVLDCVELSGKPQPTERQRIGNQIKAVFVFARSEFVIGAVFVFILSASSESRGSKSDTVLHISRETFQRETRG